MRKNQPRGRARSGAAEGAGVGLPRLLKPCSRSPLYRLQKAVPTLLESLLRLLSLLDICLLLA